MPEGGGGSESVTPQSLIGQNVSHSTQLYWQRKEDNKQTDLDKRFFFYLNSPATQAKNHTFGHSFLFAYALHHCPNKQKEKRFERTSNTDAKRYNWVGVVFKFQKLLFTTKKKQCLVISSQTNKLENSDKLTENQYLLKTKQICQIVTKRQS